MQTKIVFKSVTANGYFLKSKEIIIDKNTNSFLGDCVAELREYNKIMVSFNSSDKSAYLEIDSSKSEIPLIIKEGDTDIVISEASFHEMMLTPGYYGLNVVTSFKNYSGLYLIVPTSLEWEGLINLRKYLESVTTGLSQNLYIQRMSGQKNIYGDNESSVDKIYLHINNNIESVIDSINSIIKNPIIDIKKVYKEEYYSRKQDYKSQKWLGTKGVNKNINPYMVGITFEKHTIFHEDILENKWIKKIINKTIEIICFMEKRYNNIHKELLNRINEIKVLFENRQNEYNLIINDKTISIKHKKEKEYELKYIEEDINNIESKKKFIEGKLDNLRKIKSILLHYKNETWIRKISNSEKQLRVSHKLLKDNRYLQLYNYYCEIILIEDNNLYNRKPYFPSKNTPKLFEYYSLMAAINVILDNNFKWAKGWIENKKLEDVFNGEIPTNEPLVFIKGNYRCEIYYEKEVQSSTEISRKKSSDFIRINAQHYKPDIIIALFNNCTNELIRSIILEVKCRISKNIYNSKGPTPAIEQARDYYSFAYYDSKKIDSKTDRNAIKKIIIIYPKQKNKIEYQYDDINISFIQVEATDSKDISKHYGYNKLKEEIEGSLQLRE